MERRTVPAVSPFAEAAGYSRVVRIGPHAWVAGTAPIMPDDADPPADAYGQARRCLEIIEKAVNEAGGKREHIVRTRMFLKDMKNWQDAGRAHGEFFKDIRPASTMIQIVQAIDPAWLVEIEADAIVI